MFLAHSRHDCLRGLLTFFYTIFDFFFFNFKGLGSTPVTSPFSSGFPHFEQNHFPPQRAIKLQIPLSHTSNLLIITLTPGGKQSDKRVHFLSSRQRSIHRVLIKCFLTLQADRRGSLQSMVQTISNARAVCVVCIWVSVRFLFG